MSAEHFLPVADQKNNIIRLSAAQALAGANSVVFYATGAIVGNAIAPASSLATLPITVRFTGAKRRPQSRLYGRYRRRGYYRPDCCPGRRRRLIPVILHCCFSGRCLCGGRAQLSFCRNGRRYARTPGPGPVAGNGRRSDSVVGPMLVSGTMHLWPPHTFVVTFIAQALVAVISACILKGVKTTEPASAVKTGGRPLREIVRQPGFARTVFSGAVTYMVMNFLMTAAPLSMHMHGISQQASNLGIQWHVIAMYGPGFFTGKLINRYGAMRIAAAGLLITACSVLAGLGGTDIFHYWLSLILLGLGWNFGFTGASAKIIEYHRPEEKTQVQSLNDFVVFGVMIVGSFSSGALLSLYGWNAVLWGSLVPVGLAFLGIINELRAKKEDKLSF